jgi:hypothetical protein
MKKILTLLFLLVFLVNFAPAQQKVSFTIAPYRTLSSGIVSYMVTATVPAGQVWKVGNFNLRITYGPNPAGCLTVHADNPVDSALTGLTGGIYTSYTTTAFASPPGISLNLLTLQTQGFLNLPAGTYKLGHLRFNVTGSFLADTLSFRTPPMSPTSVVYDSTKKCAYGGSTSDSSRFTIISPVITEIEGNISTIPAEYQLFQNYPNPFNPTTTIKYDVPKTSLVKIRVYDVTGKMVSELVNQQMEAVSYEINWNGSEYASGVYFYKIETKDFTKVMRMVLIK